MIYTSYSVLDLGLTDYKKAYQLQFEFLKSRQFNEITDTLLLTEHPHVFTIGRLGVRSNLLVDSKELERKGIAIYDVDRGGDITYHGPGQLVIYPILDLKLLNLKIIDYLRGLEESAIRFFKCFGLTTTRKTGFTGIWFGEQKIVSIGIGIKRGITYHGMSININPDLSYFRFISPCGIKGLDMTSLSKILNTKLDLDSVKYKFIKSFVEVFGSFCDNGFSILD